MQHSCARKTGLRRSKRLLRNWEEERERFKISGGRDVRLRSVALSDALIKGILSTGIDVIDIGECPTPLQYFSMFHLNLDGGIMITGSHNPPEFNGFKISF